QTRATRTAARCSPAPGRVAARTARTLARRSRTPHPCSPAVRLSQMMARVREERLLERRGAHRLLELGGRAEGGEPATIQHGDASRNARSAAGGREESREQVNRGGLTGAVRPEQAEELPIPDLEVEPIESADRAKVLAEAAGVDRGGGHPFVARTRDAGAAR